MPTIEEIMKTAKEAGASDVHITVGIPPKMRVNGRSRNENQPSFPLIQINDRFRHTERFR